MADRLSFVNRVAALLGVAVVSHALAAGSEPGEWHHGEKYRAVNAYLVQGSTGVAAVAAAPAAPAAYYTSPPHRLGRRLLHRQRRPRRRLPPARRCDRVHNHPARGLRPGGLAAPSPGVRCPLRSGLRPGGGTSRRAPNVVYLTVQAAPAAATATAQPAATLTPLTPVTVLVPHSGLFCKH